jgi:hypothetical protein
MFEKKFAKKVRKYYKLSEGRGGREGREGGELLFQGLRPSTSLMAAGKNMILIENQTLFHVKKSLKMQDVKKLAS